MKRQPMVVHGVVRGPIDEERHWKDLERPGMREGFCFAFLEEAGKLEVVAWVLESYGHPVERIGPSQKPSQHAWVFVELTGRQPGPKIRQLNPYQQGESIFKYASRVIGISDELLKSWVHWENPDRVCNSHLWHWLMSVKEEQEKFHNLAYGEP